MKAFYEDTCSVRWEMDTGQRNRIKNPEIDLNQYAQLFLIKVQKHFSGGRITIGLFNKWSWNN